MASVNGNDFLSDPTGSRRFLPFEVETIYIEKAQKININGLWSQALYLFKNDFIYWFNPEETEYLNKRNVEFSMVSIEEELIQYYYRNQIEKNHSNFVNSEIVKYLSNSMIMVDLEQKTKQRINKRKLGEALTKLKYEKTQRTIEGRVQWVYKIIEKSFENREKETQNLN